MTENSSNHSLSELLRSAEAEDLSVLVDYLTDKGEGRVSLTTATCSQLVAAKARGVYSENDLDTIVKELCRFGGNSFMNALRGGVGVPYREVVSDVLEHLKGSADSSDSVELLELKILQRLASQAWERMGPAEQKEFASNFGSGDLVGPAALAAVLASIRLGGFASYQIAVILAHSMAKLLLGRGLTFATSAALTRTIGVIAGPIGWLFTAIWTLFDLASPAYRVTVPCVIHIAYMRQKKSVQTCGSCDSVNALGAKFCNECGARFPKAA